MNITTNLMGDYVNFVDTTAKQNPLLKIVIVLFVTNVFLVFFSLFFRYLNEYHFF